VVVVVVVVIVVVEAAAVAVDTGTLDSYPRELEAGSSCRPSGCLVFGSIRTLKK
jgi:hypothetical protein